MLNTGLESCEYFDDGLTLERPGHRNNIADADTDHLSFSVAIAIATVVVSNSIRN